MEPSVGPPEAPPTVPTRRPLWSGGARRNRYATLSVVLGILWLGGVASVLAVASGHRARAQIAEHWEAGADRANLGVRLGWIGIVAAVVVVILVPFTPEQLEYQWQQLERGVRSLFDDDVGFD